MHPDKPVPLGRVGCLTPGCKRTYKADDGETETVCGKCWRRLVPARLRHRYKALRARWRKIERLERRKAVQKRLATRETYSHRWSRIRTLCNRNWAEIRRSIFEASGGI